MNNTPTESFTVEPLHAEVVDIAAHLDIKGAKKLQSGISSLNNNIERLIGDRTRTTDDRILTASDYAKRQLETLEQTASTVMSDLSEIALHHKSRLFSEENKELSSSESIMLPEQLKLYRNEKVDLNNPVMAKAVAELARQGLVESSVIDAINSIHSPEHYQAFTNANNLAERFVSEYWSAARNYQDRNYNPREVDKIKASRWSEE